MLFLKELLALFAIHVYSISFITGILNEEAVLFLIILAGQGDASFWAVAFFGFLGMMFHDTLFFFLGRSNLIKRLGERLGKSPSNQRLMYFVEKIGRKNTFLMLTIARFLYGIRSSIVVYVGHKDPRFFRFTVLNSLAISIWCAVMMPVAWLAGRGFSRLFMIFRGAEKIIGLVLITALIIYFVQLIIKKYILKRKELLSIN